MRWSTLAGLETKAIGAAVVAALHGLDSSGFSCEPIHTGREVEPPHWIGRSRVQATVRVHFRVERKQRIREVEQGPDGVLYLLTDEETGALLRIEPVE